MSMRLFIILFTTLFVIGLFPVFLLQPLGSASAGITAGFLLPVSDTYHVAALMAIGVLCASIAKNAMLALLPCTLLMIVIGALMDVDERHLQSVRLLVVSAILIFALCFQLLRGRALLLGALPVCVWAYYAGVGFMQAIPSITTPLFLLCGILLSAALLLAMGVALGITVGDKAQEWFTRLKGAVAFL